MKRKLGVKYVWFQPEDTVQGALQLMYELDGMLCEIAGMEKMTLQPAAGAHGELAGLMLTNPSTLGLFESNIKEIADLVRGVGGLYYIMTEPI